MVRRSGRTSTPAKWVGVSYLGTQPVILHGTSGIRYTFVPGMTGLIDKQDLDGMLQTGLFHLTQP